MRGARARVTTVAFLAALAAARRPGDRQLEALRQQVHVKADGTPNDMDLRGNGQPRGELQAVLAAGCFWGVELAFARLPGVLRTEVGYAGGHVPNPTYDLVTRTETGHAEAVRITFDSGQLTFRKLLQVFFDIHDPTTVNRQGNDVGSQYRSAIFHHDKDQLFDAVDAIHAESQRLGAHVVTTIEALEGVEGFTPAEEYHQAYLAKLGQSDQKGATEAIRCYG